jgi:hypothetical protein
MIDYEIIIPSRRRQNELRGYFNLFPSATIFIHESEHDAYAKIVGKEKIRTHNKQGLWAIHREMILTSEHEIVVHIDDDVNKVFFNSGDERGLIAIKDPEHILSVIENTAQTAKDLGLELFGWDLQGKPHYFKPTQPFQLTTPIDTAFGTIGRRLLPDPDFFTSGGVDLNLNALLHSRVTWMDTRYFFDNGKVFGGRGGLQGLRTS